LVCQKALLCLRVRRGVQRWVYQQALLCLQGCRGVQRWVCPMALLCLQGFNVEKEAPALKLQSAKKRSPATQTQSGSAFERGSD
jgi:hypothetical protein